ncbi:MAG: 50S ribosomal protein L29 [Elusimicrobiota bacterium]
MKRKERESTKALSVPELESERAKKSKELFGIGFGKSFKQEGNPLRERYLRREIAMINTWIREKSPEPILSERSEKK